MERRELQDPSPCSRSVVTREGIAFELHYGARAADSRSAPDRRFLQVVDNYEQGLRFACSKLFSEEFGWRAPVSENVAPCRVRIGDLKWNYFGLAWYDPPTIDFNSRVFDINLDAVRTRQFAIAIHELTHLLQYASGPTRYDDGNTWLREATALACEIRALQGSPPPAYPMFYDWAVQPEMAFDRKDDESGFQATPLLLYLMARFNWNSLPAMIFDEVRRRRDAMDSRVIFGIELLAEVVQKRTGIPLVSASGPDLFGSGYCVDAAFVDENPEFLDEHLGQIVGSRTVSETFSQYPVNHAATNTTVNHLACRYYEFLPPAEDRSLQLTISSISTKLRHELRGELILVPHQGPREPSRTFQRDELGNLSLDVTGFSSVTYRKAVLVVSNCYGLAEGFHPHDNLSFVIRAETN